MSEHEKLSGPTVAPASGGPAKQLVILLHGVGANGDDLIGLARLCRFLTQRDHVFQAD